MVAFPTRQSSAKSSSGSSATVAELSAALVHEISQPLAALLINAHACQRWLSGDKPDLEQARETVQRMLRDATIAADTLAGLRSLFGCCEASRCRLDINGVIKDLAYPGGCGRGIGSAGIAIELDDTIPMVMANQTQVAQVLGNLVRNGEEAAMLQGGPRTPVVIHTRRLHPAQVLVEVCDSGPGIADLDRVFQPFFTTKQGGMGMGLAICRMIVEAHGGRIWASNNLPHGAMLSFLLPGLPDEER